MTEKCGAEKFLRFCFIMPASMFLPDIFLS
jgi:hypothetical protein